MFLFNLFLALCGVMDILLVQSLWHVSFVNRCCSDVFKPLAATPGFAYTSWRTLFDAVCHLGCVSACWKTDHGTKLSPFVNSCFDSWMPKWLCILFQSKHDSHHQFLMNNKLQMFLYRLPIKVVSVEVINLWVHLLFHWEYFIRVLKERHDKPDLTWLTLIIL